MGDAAKKLYDELERAIGSGELDKIKDLLTNKGADVKAVDSDGRPVFHGIRFNEKNPEAVIAVLLAAGAAVDQTNKYGETALHEACERGNEKAVSALLAAKANPSLSTKNKKTPVNIAVDRGYPAILKILIAHGANLEASDTWGKSPIHLAADNGREPGKRAIEAILNARPDLINRLDKDGETPLYLASSRGHEECVKLLLERGADVTIAKNNGEGGTALHAASSRHEAIVRLLLSNGAKALVNTPDKGSSNWTPLHYSTFMGEVECMKLLIEAGADWTIRDTMGKNALDHAKERENQPCIDFLEEMIRNAPKVTIRKVNIVRKGFTAVIGVCFMQAEGATFASLRESIQKDEFLNTIAGPTFAIHIPRNADSNDLVRLDKAKGDENKPFPESIQTIYISAS